MSGAGELLLRIVGLALIVAVVLTSTWAWRWRHRWGRVPGAPVMLGDGAYRNAITRTWSERGTPGRVMVVAGIGIAWGLLTTIVFAPGGLLFLLAPARHDPVRQILLTLAGLGALGSAMSGLALGMHMVRVSRAMLRRDADVIDHALPIATWSTLHHLVVFIAFTLFALHEHEPAIAFAVAAPCSIGWAHAWALAHAARWVARFQVEDAQLG